MKPLISICIPTFQRPELLNQAINSCLEQTYRGIEIIICDDSKDNASAKVVLAFGKPETIRYYHNQPSLGQADNVNRLFDLAQGDRLVLLHDDDLLLPTAIESMHLQWQVEPNLVVCFGKQYFINEIGDILRTQSCQLNEDYYRTDDHKGLQTSALWSALVAQFPNDSYMILTKAAQKVRYRNHAEVGAACDFDFGLRLAAVYDKFFFLNQYIAKYRLTQLSVLKSNHYEHLSYQLIQSLHLPVELESFRNQQLEKYASSAISCNLAIDRKDLAYKIYTSSSHSWSKRLSLKGLIQAILLVFPSKLSAIMVRKVQQRKSR